MSKRNKDLRWISMEFNPIVVDVGKTTAETLFCAPGMPYKERVTRFYELELIVGGAGSMTTEDKRYCTMRGNVFFRKPGMKTQGIAGYYCYAIAFDPMEHPERRTVYSTTIPYWITDKNTQLEDCGFYDKYPDCYQTRYFEQLLPLFEEVGQLFVENPVGAKEKMRTKVQEIFCIIDNECSSGNMLQASKSVLKHYDLILSCKQYIDNNLEKHFTLDELAAECGLSKNFFSKTFKEVVGMTPFEYIIESRMLLARKLILTTNISIDQIVSLCGFDDRTYFYRMFKKRFHSAPAMYRKSFIEQSVLE